MSQGAMAERSGGLDADHEAKPRAVSATAGGVPGEIGNLRAET